MTNHTVVMSRSSFVTHVGVAPGTSQLMSLQETETSCRCCVVYCYFLLGFFLVFCRCLVTFRELECLVGFRELKYFLKLRELKYLVWFRELQYSIKFRKLCFGSKFTFSHN